MSDQFNSSAGEPGVNERSYERWYENAQSFGDDPDAVQENFALRLQEADDRDLSRTVVRQIVSPAVLSELQTSEFQDDIEVVVPMSLFTTAEGQRHSGLLLYIARNRADRPALTSDGDIIAASDDPDQWSGRGMQTALTLPERASSIRENGGVFDTVFERSEIDEIVDELWGPTFDWDEEDAINFRHALERQNQLQPEQRSLWFSAIRMGGSIVSLATAERITLQSGTGPIEMVESTEWLVRNAPELRGQHLMSTNLAVLNALVATDQATGPHGVPLVFAECNFSTRSDLAGRAAGFRIAHRNADGLPAPQVIRQNVAVGDSINTGREDNLRDFNFTYICRGTYNNLYGNGRARAILQAAGLEG